MRDLLLRFAKTWAALILASVFVVLNQTSARGQTAGQERKLFANSIVPLPATRGIDVRGLRAEQANDTLEIHFSMEKRKVSELQEKIEKGESVEPEEMERDYLPLPSDYERLLSWLKAEGFEITQTSSDRTDIYAQGTVAKIEKSLQVTIVNVTLEGVTYESTKTAPSLPADIGAHVLGINGLQPYLEAHRQSVKFTPQSPGVIRSTGSQTSADPGLSRNLANKPPYLVSEVLGAYNANNLPVTGSGQEIAILIDTVPDDEDLKAFWTNNKLSVTLKNVEEINVNGGKLPPPVGEETLDVEWSTAAAPGATVRVYAAGSLRFVDLDKALDRIIADIVTQPGMHQLSISLGLGEGFIDRNEAAAEHQKFRLSAVLSG
jgi:kumamolisin